MSASSLPLDFLCPAGNHHLHHRAIEKPPQQQHQRQPHTRHLPPGLPGAIEGHQHHRRAARTPASSSSSSSDGGDGDGSIPQQTISTYLRRIAQAAEALAAAADQEDHALRVGGVLPSDGNLLVMEAICRETVGALHAIHRYSRAVAATLSSASTPSPSPAGRTTGAHDDVLSSASASPRKLLSAPPHHRRHRVPNAVVPTTTSSSSTSSSAAVRGAVEANGAAAAATAADPSPSRRRRTCNQCGCTETPFWRRGPLGSRSLCNVCGLLYARRVRDRRDASRSRTLQWAGSSEGGAGDLTSWRSSGGSSGSLFP